MRLLVDNVEVCSRRVSVPPRSSFEAVCELAGIPFRYDAGADIFAMYPPLTGSRVFVRFFCDDPGSHNHLRETFHAEMRLLKRLLWLAGAELSVEEMREPRDAEARWPGDSGYWDLGLFVYGGLVFPGIIDPVVVYPWWERLSRSYRLAGRLALAGDETTYQGLNRASSWRLPEAIKRWFSRCREAVAGPSVLIAVPLVHGYNDQIIGHLSVVVSNGVLAFLGKACFDTKVKEAFLQEKAGTGPEKAERTEAQKDPGGAVPPVEPAVSSQVVMAEEKRTSRPEVKPVAPETPRVPRATGTPQAGGEERAPAATVPGTIEGDSTMEELRRQARQHLSSRGIEPTEELVNEYILYLMRMGNQPDHGDTE